MMPDFTLLSRSISSQTTYMLADEGGGHMQRSQAIFPAFSLTVSLGFQPGKTELPCVEKASGLKRRGA